MYKLLIVDDEEIVRRSVSKIVDWTTLGFSTVLQAENGLEALKLSLSEKPDLILADIRMPFMDGLELAQAVREQLPNTFVVILSGHDEFKYAQEAIGIGVLDYILKPLGAASLTLKMQEIKSRMDDGLREKHYLVKVRDQLRQSLPLLRENYLNTLVCTPGSKPDAEKRLKFLELPLDSGPYVVCVIEPDLGLLDPGDAEIYSMAVKNIVRESLGDNHPIFSDRNGRIVIILRLEGLPSYNEHEEDNMLFDMLAVVQKSMEIFLKTASTFATGIRADTLSELNSSYNNALAALECKYTLGKGRIYNIYDLDYRESEFFYPFDAVNELMTHIKSCQAGHFSQDLASITALLKAGKASPANMKLVFIEMTTDLLKLLGETNQVPPGVWASGLELYNRIEKLKTMDEMAGVLHTFALAVSGCLAEIRTNSAKQLVAKAKEYVDCNYGREDLSLNSTSAHIAVSAGYLSALFKKESGTNFSDYLTKVRMEKAMELLRKTDMKTYEVAYVTGFSNPHYFSVSFRKYTGRSPSEFRGTPEE